MGRHSWSYKEALKIAKHFFELWFNRKENSMSKAEDHIKKNTNQFSNEDGFVLPLLTPDQAEEAVEIAREEMLEYVKYQLDLRLPETLDYNGVKVERKDFINDFIQAMKDE